MRPTLLMILAIAMVIMAIFERTDNIKTTKSDFSTTIIKPKFNVNFIYLTTFCLHLGSQYWMTLVSGKLHCITIDTVQYMVVVYKRLFAIFMTLDYIIKIS